MIVENEELDIFIIKTIMAQCAFAKEVEVITDVDTALIKLANAKYLPDFIFLDINFPGKNGFELLKELKLMPDSVREVKVIVLTASLNKADELKAKQFKQVAGFLIKPLKHSDLNELKKQYNFITGR